MLVFCDYVNDILAKIVNKNITGKLHVTQLKQIFQTLVSVMLKEEFRRQTVLKKLLSIFCK